MMIDSTLPWLTLALVCLLMVLQVLDVVSTNRVLSLGGREFNPVMVWIMRRTGWAWWLPKLALAAVPLSLALIYADPRIDAVLAGIGAAYVVVVSHNFLTAWRLARAARPLAIQSRRL